MKVDYDILKTIPIKGKKLEGSKDYVTRIKAVLDDKIIFDEIVMVRKNKAGVFPETDSIKKIKKESVRRELINDIKTHFKKVK